MSKIRLFIQNGKTANNLSLYPMVTIDGTATSFDPYSNIRPLSGWDKLELVRCGAQILDDTNLSGIVLSTMHRFPGPFKVAGTYTVSVSITGGTEQGITFAIRTATSNIKQYTVQNKKPVTIEITDDILQRLDNCTIYTWSGSVGATLDWIMINKGSTALPYEPYHGTLHTLQIGQTVYGGRAEWTKGKMVADRAAVVLDGTQAVATYFLGSHGKMIVRYRVEGAIDLPSAEFDARLISDKLRTVDANAQYRSEVNTIACAVGGNVLMVCIDGLTTKEEVSAWLAANPVTAVYPLATPIEIQFEPHEIIALPGTNTLYGDGDTITVAGRQPQTNALESRLAALEAVITNA